MFFPITDTGACSMCCWAQWLSRGLLVLLLLGCLIIISYDTTIDRCEHSQWLSGGYLVAHNDCCATQWLLDRGCLFVCDSGLLVYHHMGKKQIWQRRYRSCPISVCCAPILAVPVVNNLMRVKQTNREHCLVIQLCNPCVFRGYLSCLGCNGQGVLRIETM